MMAMHYSLYEQALMKDHIRSYLDWANDGHYSLHEQVLMKDDVWSYLD
jgi:hypothetical protein